MATVINSDTVAAENALGSFGTALRTTYSSSEKFIDDAKAQFIAGITDNKTHDGIIDALQPGSGLNTALIDIYNTGTSVTALKTLSGYMTDFGSNYLDLVLKPMSKAAQDITEARASNPSQTTIEALEHFFLI